MKITKSLIDHFVYEKSGNRQDIRWDSQTTGFGVRIYPSGKKTFVVSYRVQGRKRIMTVGRYGILTLDEARGRSISILSQALNGRDPLADRKQAYQTMTIREFGEEYIRRHSKPHNKTWNKTEGRLKRHVYSAIGSRWITSISRTDIADLHYKISQKAPYEANRIVALLSSMFERAKEWGYFEGENPARKIKKNREKKRDRWLSSEELPSLFMAINQEQNIYARNAIWLYLLTGLRKSELLNSKWEDVNWNDKILRIPETKAGRVHYLPLSEAVLSILNKLPKIEDNPYILPGSNPRAPIVNIDKPWYRIRKAAGLEDVRLHDLRRTVGSWLAQAGNSLHLIGRVLNHSNPKTTQVYAHFAEDHVRNALEAHAKRILACEEKVKQEPVQKAEPPKHNCKVIPFRPKFKEKQKFVPSAGQL